MLKYHPLISIIVPVYKVQSHLHACLDSILAQTYTNLQILLIDDGSPDGCPTICDNYANKDSRVQVIHQKNGGLSDARNTGLNQAIGEYIGFVDSDDIINRFMFQILVDEAISSGADIVGCNYLSCATESFTKIKTFKENRGFDESNGIIHGVDKRCEMKGQEAVCLLLRDEELQNYVWNKLYKATLWRGIRFPVGQRFEDINTTYRLFERANQVVLLPEVLYYYQIRKDSIVQSCSLESEIDCVKANIQRYEDLRARYPMLNTIMLNQILHSIIKVWFLVWPERDNLSKKMHGELKYFANFAYKNLPSSTLYENLGVTGRLSLFFIQHARFWAWWITWRLYRVYRIKHPTI